MKQPKPGESDDISPLDKLDEYWEGLHDISKEGLGVEQKEEEIKQLKPEPAQEKIPEALQPVSTETAPRASEPADSPIERQPTVSSEKLKQPVRWKLKPDRYGREAEPNQQIRAREKWLADVIGAKDNELNLDISHARQRAWETAEINLQAALKDSGKGGTVLDRFVKKEPAAGRRGLQLLETDLAVSDAPVNKSPLELFDANNPAMSDTDLRAMRLIGLSLLREGSDASGQKPFAEMPEGTKRLIRLGELIALEANGKLIERAVLAGKCTPERARHEIGIYSRYKTTHDLPDAMYERFSKMETLLRDSFDMPERQPQRQETTAAARARERVARPVESSQATQPAKRPEQNPIPAQKEKSISDILQPYLHKPETPERRHEDRFMEHFADQMEYAQWMSQQKAWHSWVIPGKWFADKLYKMGKHTQIFGWRESMAPLFLPSQANENMSLLRGRIRNALDAYKDDTGDKQFSHYEDILTAAIKAESPKKELTVERQHVIDEDLADEGVVDAKGQSTKTPVAAATPEPVTQQETLVAPTAVAADKEAKKLDESIDNDAARSFLGYLEGWRRKNNAVYRLEAWKGFVDEDVEKQFADTLAYMRKKLGNEKMGEEELWELIGERAGIRPQSTRPKGKKAA